MMMFLSQEYYLFKKIFFIKAYSHQIWPVLLLRHINYVQTNFNDADVVMILKSPDIQKTL